MLVATSVATDTRVLREATTLVDAGHEVHVVGKDVPPDFVPPPGVTVSSAGASSVFRPTGAPSSSGRRLSSPQRLARWALLPQHRNQAFGSWARAAQDDARTREFDVVHAHDFTALEAGATLAAQHGVPYVYDSHELWLGRQRQYRPTPLQDRRERAVESRLGQHAAAVITVGDGVAAALRRDYGWQHVVVVRNTFPQRVDDGTTLPARPTGLVYAGRVDAHRDLEAVVAAARLLPDLPVTLLGPSDDVWVGRHAAAVAAAGVELAAVVPVADVTRILREKGLALVTGTDLFESHVLSLPNKLFHAVHAGVPVVAIGGGEIGAVVQGHGLGEVYTPGDSGSLAEAVRRAVERYDVLLENVAAAGPELAWPADAARLRQVYDGLTVG
jgi:glycogen synthase